MNLFKRLATNSRCEWRQCVIAIVFSEYGVWCAHHHTWLDVVIGVVILIPCFMLHSHWFVERSEIPKYPHFEMKFYAGDEEGE